MLETSFHRVSSSSLAYLVMVLLRIITGTTEVRTAKIRYGGKVEIREERMSNSMKSPICEAPGKRSNFPQMAGLFYKL